MSASIVTGATLSQGVTAWRSCCRCQVQRDGEPAVEPRAAARGGQLVADDRRNGGGADPGEHLLRCGRGSGRAAPEWRSCGSRWRLRARHPAAGQDLQVPEPEPDDGEQHAGEHAEQLDAPAEHRRQRRTPLERALDHARDSGLSPPCVVQAWCSIALTGWQRAEQRPPRQGVDRYAISELSSVVSTIAPASP
jgi:hypothetical protein